MPYIGIIHRKLNENGYVFNKPKKRNEAQRRGVWRINTRTSAPRKTSHKHKQQRPESPSVALTCHASKYKVHKHMEFRYINTQSLCILYLLRPVFIGFCVTSFSRSLTPLCVDYVFNSSVWNWFNLYKHETQPASQPASPPPPPPPPTHTLRERGRRDTTDTDRHWHIWMNIGQRPLSVGEEETHTSPNIVTRDNNLYTLLHAFYIYTRRRESVRESVLYPLSHFLC